jgi:hypothetical protein
MATDAKTERAPAMHEAAIDVLHVLAYADLPLRRAASYSRAASIRDTIVSPGENSGRRLQVRRSQNVPASTLDIRSFRKMTAPTS